MDEDRLVQWPRAQLLGGKTSNPSAPAFSAAAASRAASRLDSALTPDTTTHSRGLTSRAISTTLCFSPRSSTKFSPAWPLTNSPRMPGQCGPRRCVPQARPRRYRSSRVKARLSRRGFRSGRGEGLHSFRHPLRRQRSPPSAQAGDRSETAAAQARGRADARRAARRYRVRWYSRNGRCRRRRHPRCPEWPDGGQRIGGLGLEAGPGAREPRRLQGGDRVAGEPHIADDAVRHDLARRR